MTDIIQRQQQKVDLLSYTTYANDNEIVFNKQRILFNAEYNWNWIL